MSVVSGNKVSSSTGVVDIRLKSIQVKAVWGGRASNNYRSLIALADYQYIMPVGSGMMIFDNNARLPKQSQLINANVPGISYVLFMSPSPDLKYLAVVARFKDEDDSAIMAHVYSMDTLIYEYRCPNIIKYKCPSDVHLPSGLKLEMKSLEFSNDNQFVVCTTNYPPIGVLIFDLVKCTLFASVPTATIPYHASFDPIDPFKICVTGEMGLLAFIRFNMKKVHSPAPALGLKGGKNVSYTCHIWVPTMEGVVVSGSDRGFLCVIEGCEQKHPNNYAFGSPTTRIQTEPPEVLVNTSTDFKPVVQLLLRGDILLALSSGNELAVFELRRVMKSNVNSSAIFLLNKYRLANMHSILGMQWCLLDSLTSFEVIAMSRDSVFEFEIARDTAPILNDMSEIVYSDFIDEKYVLRYHWDSIRSLSLSTRTNLLATNSYKDSTTRIWNFNQPTSFTGTWVIENYQDPPDDNPLYIDIHPAGIFTAYAMEHGVKEFAVTDGILQLYRNIDIKTPFIGPNGVPFIINQPVSMVKYSNNGHLLAVVTGKLAQIFSLFLTDYNSPALYGQPTRIMMLTDHIAPITDIAFNRDDTVLFTTSSDGSIYSWIVGAYSRHQEYVHRGVSARRVAVTKNHNTEAENYIIACYEVQSELLSDLPIIRQMAKTQRGGGDSQQKPMIGSRHGRQKSRLFESVEESNNNSNKKSFLAIWKGSAHVSLNPDILQLDCPVRSIALGDADGIEKIDICVLGMADGRILIARLPLPIVRAIDITSPLISAPNTALSDDTSRLGFGSSSHRHKGGILDQDGGEIGRRRDMAINHSTNSRINNKHDNNSNDSSTDASVMSILEANNKDTTTITYGDASGAEHLDEKSCFQFDIHVGPVNGVVISPNGMWIFSAGDDGVIFMFATNKRGLDMIQINEGLENRFHLMDRLRLKNLHTQLSDSINLVDMNEKEFEIKMNSMIDEKNKVIHDQQVKTLKDLKHRDETILQCRNDYLKLKASVNSEMAAIQRECEATIHDVELTYEQKLSQETLYLDKLKQAYDEFVIHSRLDLNEVQRKTDERIEAIELDRDEAFSEVEKQKTVLLQYYDYIQVRNDEIFESLEDQQVEERQRLKGELKQTKDDLAIAQSAVLTSEVQASREAQKLMSIIEEKEADLLRLHSRVDWAHGRILELEQVLAKATGDLVFRTEMSEKWELKAGIAQQNVIELEKLRKVLTSQLHNLREEFGPKEDTLLRVSSQLEETDREYELSLQAIADKERILMQKSENLNMLHKQVRDLRNLSSRKDKALRRAATLLEDYKYSLREAYFVSEKRTIPVMGYENGDELHNMTPTMEAIIMKRKKPTIIGTDVVEIIAQNEGMKNALKRLNDVLTPFMDKSNSKSKADDGMEDVVQEQERQMEMLHRNVNILQASLDVANNASSHKIENHLRDNQNLLKEVNNLRFEVRSLSMENQRLLAHFEFMNRGANKEDGTSHKPAVPYRTPKVPVPVPILLRDLEESTTNFNESYVAKESKNDDNNYDVVAVDELSQFEMSAFVPELKMKSNMPRSISLPMFIKPVRDDMVKDKVAAAIMNATTPLHFGGDNDGSSSNAHHDRTYSIPIVEMSKARKMSKGNNNNNNSLLSTGEERDDSSNNPLKSKNEFSRSTADEKIAKLMEMNLHEIKATMKVEVVTKSGGTTDNKQHSSSSFSSIPQQGVSTSAGLPVGSIASSRQSSQPKTRSSRDSSGNSSSSSKKKNSSNDISLLVTMGKALPRKESRENNHSKLSAATGVGGVGGGGGGSSVLDQPDRSVHMEESTSTIFNDSVTMLPAIVATSNSNNNNNNHNKRK